MKITSGPWGLKRCSHGGMILLREDIVQSHLQIVPEADAHAIGAIPEMMAALEKCIKFIHNECDGFDDGAFEEGCDALRKARRGES